MSLLTPTPRNRYRTPVEQQMARYESSALATIFAAMVFISLLVCLAYIVGAWTAGWEGIQ